MWYKFNTNSYALNLECLSLEFIVLLLQIYIALTTTKLTKDIAFNEMFHSHIMPPILMRISATINRITIAAIKSNPVNMNETAKIVAKEIPNENSVSLQMVKYCS